MHITGRTSTDTTEARSRFFHAFSLRLMNASTQWYDSDNWDPYRFGKPPRDLRSRILARLSGIRGPLAVVPRRLRYDEAVLSWITLHHDMLGWLYNRLADDASRRVLIDTLAYRLLGFHKVQIGEPDLIIRVRKTHDIVQTCKTKSKILRAPAPYDWFNEYNLHAAGFPLYVFGTDAIVRQTFVLEQYKYVDTGTTLGPRTGETVIDAGAGWGDTALWAAHYVGPGGSVHAFEPGDANQRILSSNLERNPEYIDRITVVPAALSDREAEGVHLIQNGLGTRLADGNGDAVSETRMITLDRYLADSMIEKIDFVKIDVEGAEFAVLRGGRITISTSRPIVAVAVYHQLDDLIEIPQLMEDYLPGSLFYLGHTTLHFEETILFVAPSEKIEDVRNQARVS